MAKIPETGEFTLLDVRDNVQLSGEFHMRQRRAIWIAFQIDSKIFKGNIAMSDFRGKDYDESWVYYGEEQLHHSVSNTNNGNYSYTKDQIISSPYIEDDWQYRWAIYRVDARSQNVRTSNHGRKRHSRYSRSERWEMRYWFSAYKKTQRRAW